MVYNIDKYFPSTRSIFINALLENWEPVTEDNNLVFSSPLVLMLVSQIYGVFSLPIITY